MTITRRHKTETGWREAIYSDCETYRYRLTVTWNENARRLLYVMLNPSKATELANDPTIERCERRAQNLGYGAFGVVNLFALRETSPKYLMSAEYPEGAENTDQIQNATAWTNDILAAWGVHGNHRDRARTMAEMLRQSGKPLLHLGLTKAGQPRHPLYVAYQTIPAEWN